MAKEKKIKVKKKIDWKHEMALAPGYILLQQISLQEKH